MVKEFTLDQPLGPGGSVELELDESLRAGDVIVIRVVEDPDPLPSDSVPVSIVTLLENAVFAGVDGSIPSWTMSAAVFETGDPKQKKQCGALPAGLSPRVLRAKLDVGDADSGMFAAGQRETIMQRFTVSAPLLRIPYYEVQHDDHGVHLKRLRRVATGEVVWERSLRAAYGGCWHHYPNEIVEVEVGEEYDFEVEYEGGDPETELRSGVKFSFDFLTA